MRPPSSLLSRIPPYSLAISLVRCGPRIGVAHSDPYLSCAQPLTSLPSHITPWELASVLRGLRLGLLVFALPLRERPNTPSTSTRHAIADMHEMASRLHRMRGTPVHSVPQCVWARRCTPRVVQEQCSNNALWQEIESARPKHQDFRRMPPAVVAAIALQDLLDEEMCGWPNTFG